MTVEAFPNILPADGKSTAFLVAKVTDEAGKPLAGKEVLFWADGGQVLVRKAMTDGQGIALSRLCSERLPKGQKKVVTVKAKTNPEGETSVLMDGSLPPSSSPSVPVSLKVFWQPSNDSPWQGVSQGETGGCAAIVFQADPPSGYLVWCNYMRYEEQVNHPLRQNNGEDVNLQNDGNTWSWVPVLTFWETLHRSEVVVFANYTVVQMGFPEDPSSPLVTATASITVSVRNVVLKVLSPDPPFLIWDPEDPAKNRLTVTFSIDAARKVEPIAKLQVYRLDRLQDQPIRVIEGGEKIGDGVYAISWDGKEEGGVDAERGLYAFQIIVRLPQLPHYDSDARVSPFLKILSGGSEAEYYGYDDKGTEDVGDDEHIFLVRYGLRCASAMIDDDGDYEGMGFRDEDGDGRLDEDWVNEMDDDGDGRVDEDPGGGFDEDKEDGMDNDGDGRVDEDPPNPVNASAGEILVYDPDLEPLRDEQGNIRRIDIRSLPCVEHGGTDGLGASLEGMYHGVLVRVPVSFVQKAGSYHFVIRAWDNHAHLYKDHQVKPALEVNDDWKTPKLLLNWAPMRPGQEFRYQTRDPNSGVMTDQVFPDLPEPYRRFSPSEIAAYLQVKVRVQVYDRPKANRKVYLRLLDPDDPSAPDTPEENDIDDNDRGAMGNLYPRGGDNRSDAWISSPQGTFVRLRPDGSEENFGTDTEVTTNENGYAEAIVRLSIQPGNNFKVGGAFEASVRDQMRIGEGTQETALRVFVGDQRVPEGSKEPDITPVARATPLLTVWRRLWVERDRMAPAPSGTQFGEDDRPLDNFGMPLDAIRQAMMEAYVEVREYQWNTNSLTWWKYNFVVNDNEDVTDDEDWQYCITGLQNHPPTRDSRNDEDTDYFWCVYVIGVYELGRDAGKGIGNDGDPIPNDLDNDPNTENPITLGITLPREPEASLISREQVRDFAVEEALNLDALWVLIIGHEIGHQFELRHNEIQGHLMYEDMRGLGPRWLPKDIDAIRSLYHP